MRAPPGIRTATLRVAALTLLLMLILTGTLTSRTLNRTPNTLLYFVTSEGELSTLESRTRHLPLSDPETQLGRTLGALLAGPSSAETASGLRSALPPDLQVLGLRLEGGTLYLNLSRGVTEGGAHQLRYTLTQPSYVQSLQLSVAGEPLLGPGDENTLTDHLWQRSQHAELPRW